MSRRPKGEIVLALTRPEELVTADMSGLLGGGSRLEPAVVELVEELLGRTRKGRSARIVVTLPPDQLGPETPALVQGTVVRYCHARLAVAERESRSLWRQGLRSLSSGSILFAVGLLLSAEFLEPDVDSFWQNLLGNGAFLVVAWVGLWYPLDLLFFARLPWKREQEILRMLLKRPIEVRPQ